MNKVGLQDIREEIRDMLSVCFEGEIEKNGEDLCMVLPNGQRFRVFVSEEAA